MSILFGCSLCVIHGSFPYSRCSLKSLPDNDVSAGLRLLSLQFMQDHCKVTALRSFNKKLLLSKYHEIRVCKLQDLHLHRSCCASLFGRPPACSMAQQRVERETGPEGEERKGCPKQNPTGLSHTEKKNKNKGKKLGPCPTRESECPR